MKNDTEGKILSTDRRGMWFPLTVAIGCFMLAMVIMVYVLNMGSGTKYDFIELPNGYKLIQMDEQWVVDSTEVSVIAPNVTHIAVKDDKIYYKRVKKGTVEVGCYDTKLKYFTDSTNESYEMLEKKFKDNDGVTLIKVKEYEDNLK